MYSKVEILLPTYNGEKYIKDQLSSIWAQDYPAIELLIRDDGSSDRTVEIMKENLIGKPARLIEGENIGVVRGFFYLLSQVPKDADYIALCDQDDVWLSDKISTAIEALEKENPNEPVLYCSAVQPVNQNLIPVSQCLHYTKVIPSFENALVENMCTGCTAVMNRKLFELLRNQQPEFTVMHDFWIYLLASCFGKVIYDSTPHILYRQHTDNQIGMATNLFENYKRRVMNFRKHRGQLMRQVHELERLYMIPEENKKVVDQFLQIPRSFKARVKLLGSKKVYRQRKSDDVILKILILIGKL